MMHTWLYAYTYTYIDVNMYMCMSSQHIKSFTGMSFLHIFPLAKMNMDNDFIIRNKTKDKSKQ